MSLQGAEPPAEAGRVLAHTVTGPSHEGCGRPGATSLIDHELDSEWRARPARRRNITGASEMPYRSGLTDGDGS